MEEIKIALQYLKRSIKARMQYRADTVVATLAVFLREATGIIVIYLTLLKFGVLGDWDVNELLFLYSILFLTYAFVVVLFADLRDFSRMIREGRFDRLMITPRGLLFQLISNNADVIAALGHGTLGIILFVFTANNVGITWNLPTILYYVCAIIGGVLLQGGIFIFFSSLSFFFVETNSLRNIFYWNMRRFAGYPISIFNKIFQVVMIYVVPFAFVNYFPAQFLLRKEDMAQYPEMFMYIAPVIGLAVYCLAYLFWRFSIKHYKSTGN